MKAVGLGELVLFLDAQNASSFRGMAVDTFLAKHQVVLDDVLPYTRFREDTYARNLVRRTPEYELFVLGWLPGQKAGIHDHAGQRCWTVILSGEVLFQNYQPISDFAKAPLPVGKPEVKTVGDTIYIDDDIGLHRITNEAKIPAVTLHLYAGPISHCLVFDETKGRFKQVELHCFPPPPEAVWENDRPRLRPS